MKSNNLKPSRNISVLTHELCEALLTPRTRDDMRRLLQDLCTPSEVRALAERWHVARPPYGTDLSYRHIHEGTGVSTPTIVRVGRFLRDEPHQGYRHAIDALEAHNVR